MRLIPASLDGPNCLRLGPYQREETSVLLPQAILCFRQLPDLVVQSSNLFIFGFQGIPLGFGRLLDALLGAVRLTGDGLAHGAGDSLKF